MFLSILTCFIAALLSTAIIWPWFWKGILVRKTLVGDTKNIGFKESYGIKREIIIQTFMFAIVFLIPLLIYIFGKQEYIYIVLISIIFVSVFQMLIICCTNIPTKKLAIGVLTAVTAICIIMTIMNSIIYDQKIIDITKIIEIPVSVSIESIMQNKAKQAAKNEILTATEVKEIFLARKASGPYSTNNKIVYILEGGIRGYGVVVIEAQNAKTAKFIPCIFKNEISLKLREEYLTIPIKKLGVVVTDDNKVFATFGIIKKIGFFGPLVVDKYILQNMIEESEFVEQNNSPDFAK